MLFKEIIIFFYITLGCTFADRKFEENEEFTHPDNACEKCICRVCKVYKTLCKFELFYLKEIFISRIFLTINFIKFVDGYYYINTKEKFI